MAASVGAPGNLHVVGILKQMALGVPSIDDQVVGLVIAIEYIFESKRLRIVLLEHFLIIRVKNYLGDGKSVVTRGGGLHGDRRGYGRVFTGKTDHRPAFLRGVQSAGAIDTSASHTSVVETKGKVQRMGKLQKVWRKDAVHFCSRRGHRQNRIMMPTAAHRALTLVAH